MPVTITPFTTLYVRNIWPWSHGFSEFECDLLIKRSNAGIASVSGEGKAFERPHSYVSKTELRRGI